MCLCLSCCLIKSNSLSVLSGIELDVLSYVNLVAILVICFVLFFAGSGYGNPTYRTRCLGCMAKCTDNIDGYSVSSATFNRLHTPLES